MKRPRSVLFLCSTLSAQPRHRRRTAEGKTKAEIIRCLKRYVAREVWGYLHPDRHVASVPELAA